MKKTLGWVAVTFIFMLNGGCKAASASIPPTEIAALPQLNPTTSPAPSRVNPTSSSKELAPELTPTPVEIFPSKSCQRSVCTYTIQFPLGRPIGPLGNQKVEASYRYGSTQNGQREVHHGVDIINKAGVPVLAAANGEVVFAGTDDQQSFSPKRDFYGKLIILQHNLEGIADPVYTLYGHLLKIQVENGQTVRAGDQIGEVGLGGVAAGTHLHFEVRYGKNDYDSTRNPELWVPPLTSSSGVLAGIFFDQQHQTVNLDNFILESLGNSSSQKKSYYSTYEEPTMVNLPPWYENFAMNDLPVGKYRLSYVYKHLVQFEFEILAEEVTFLNIGIK